MNHPIKTAILLFNEVEVLDFAGPFEVFSLAEYPTGGGKAFNVYTVAEKPEPIRARNGLMVLPSHTLNTLPDCDILIIPGGYGAREIEIHNKALIDWIKESSHKASLVASVCTGAFLLAKAGLLNGHSATTHWMSCDRLEREFPLVTVRREVKYVDEGALITSGGISAGINMSLYIVSKLIGIEAACATARRMEYDIEL